MLLAVISLMLLVRSNEKCLSWMITLQP